MAGLCRMVSRTETNEVMSCSPAPARSTGLVTPADGGNRARSALLTSAVNSGTVESGSLDDVGRDTCVPAAVRDDADPAHLRGSVTEEGGRHVRELPWTRHPVHPGGPAGRVDDRAVGRQRSRVRLRPADGGLAATHRQQQDRLPRPGRLGGGVDERPPVTEVLAVHGDEIGVVVLDAGADEVGGAEVCLVPERGEPGEPVSAGLEELAEFECHVAALGEQRDPAGGKRVRGQRQRRARIQHTQAVRPEEDGPGGPHPLHDPILHSLSGSAEFGETGGDADDRGGACREGVVHGLLETLRRDGDDDEIDSFVEFRQAPERGVSQDALAAPVDEVDRPVARHAESLDADPVAVLRLVVAGTEDGDRPGIEQRREVAVDDRAHRVSSTFGAG